MLWKILGKLLNRNDFEDDYKAKPSHLIYSFLIMGSGSRFWFYDKLEWLGTLIVIIGFVYGISIPFLINWDKSISYWSIVRDVTDTLHKINNPEIWDWAHRVFGLETPEILPRVTVKETEDKGQGSFGWKYKEVDISPMVMNQIANKVLYNFTANKTLDFTEEMYSSLIPNFKKNRKAWIKEGKLVPKNPKNTKNGYRLSKKGYTMFYQFASENMKLRED